ncbi:MAG TPA: nicotinate-nucleotide adenylyltransferase [Coxiellaceae bacterium]|nr:MAG: nicotinate (nicotinamide) nucleotide adenylyltransferase [Gammaproteobacteria bacterium RIFCSPHIGHO2_12_FULL_36_30]HLB56816.1 nicotinate-nucleotide adenylyltransferase [Coxiellaceae bacterium]
MNIGILGGTFDPIHEGHITIADHVLKKFKLERVDFIPCFQPAHRDQPIASAKDRLEMVKLAIKNHPEFIANDIEIKREGISYTVDTLQALQKQFPKNNYYLIIGADAFAKFDTWHEWEKMITIGNIIVVNRNDRATKVPKKVLDFIEKNKLVKNILFYDMHPILISASQIRKDAAAGKEKINGLAQLVQEYILKNGIYS